MDKDSVVKLAVFGMTGLLMGILFTSQSKSVSQATLYYTRETKESIFQEIQIVKQSNDNLKEEIDKLKKDLSETTSQEAALRNIENEIWKYRIVAGESQAMGPGVRLKINSDLPAIWLIDSINEFNSAGAEVISINGVRMTNLNIGFDTIPNGQILMGDTILTTPIVIEAIGNQETLFNTLSQAGGLIQRLKDFKPSLEIELNKVDNLTIGGKQ